MSRTVAEMVNKLTSTGRTITSTTQPALRAMAGKAEASVLAEARKIVPDLNLSGVGTKGAKIGVRTRVGATHAEVKATGPWQFIEFRTKAHVITSKRFTGPRRGRGERVAAGQRTLRAGFRGLGVSGAAIRTPYGPRTYVKHPGTKGQLPFKHGVDRALPQLPKIASQVYRQQISRIFR